MKKGQVTIFIILGIIILIGAGLFYVIRSESIKEDLDTEVLKAVEQIPVEFRPVAAFIEGCLEDTAKEGLKKLGERGGFIDLIDNGIITKEAPTESAAVQQAKGSSLAAAYWWYLDSPNYCETDCSFGIVPEQKLALKKNPSKVSIESQLEDYIKESLQSCIENFAVPRSQGFTVTEKSPPSPTVQITENDVIVLIDYPLEVERASKKELSKFYTRLPVNMNRIFTIAKDITDMEAERHILERHALNLMLGFSGISDKKLPPMSDTRFSLGTPVTWRRSQVKENMAKMLTSNIKLLRVYGTKNHIPYPFAAGSLFDGLYNNGMLIPGSDDYGDIEVILNYNPLWDMYFDLNCNGEECRPESFMSDLVTLIGFHNYNFVYDLSFPVEVEIYDTSAYNGQGYRFKYFLEANIRDNDPLTANYSGLEGEFTESTMLCDENKRTSGEVSIDTFDYMTGGKLDGVQIGYSSLEETCLIGATQEGNFEGKFPVMLGGVVSFIKEGYLTESRRLDTSLGIEDTLAIKLKPKLDKAFTVKKVVMAKKGIWQIENESNLTSDEQAIISLIRIPELEEQPFSTSAVYWINMSEPASLQIIPGRYEMKIDLTYGKEIKIPPGKIEFEGKEYPINGTTLGEGFRTGGISLNYTFTKEALAKDEIIFFVLNPDIISIPESQRSIEDVNFIAGIDETARMNRANLLPKFI